MADQKIHEYPIERFVFGDDDYYDVDFWDGFIYQTAKIKGSVIKSAMLSGIAINLTAPSAFIVGGSPTDGTGTLTLTAAGLANQYIRGDGTLATLPTSGGGGNNVNYYLNGGTSASVATYYQMSKTAVIGTGVDFSLAGNGLISQWLTDVGDPNVTEIPSGAWDFEMYFSASSSGGVPKFYVELLKYDGATFTSIANNSATPEAITSGTTIDLYLTSVAVPLTSLAIGDRLAIRVYIVDSVLGRTIKHHTQDSHLCQITTTFSSGVSSINGLTKQTQYLTVGTSGTDFAINSVTDTHTFNLPTASATKRGALSSANWSTFNGKQNPITLTTTGSGVATFVADVLNIPTSTSGITVGTTPITSGTDTRVLFQNGGVVSQSTNLVFDASSQLVIGGHTGGAKLDVKAGGALSTDLAFRVRNSADTFDIIKANGRGDVFIGQAAGRLTTGVGNNFIGINAGCLNITGQENTAIGNGAGTSNLSSYNTYLGASAGQNGTTATGCVFLGYGAGQSSNAQYGVFIGYVASTTGGNGTVSIGYSAGAGTGSHNLSLGQSSGLGMTTGSFNTHLGYRSVGSGVTTGNYNNLVGSDIVIGNVSNNAVLSDNQGHQAIRKDANHNVLLGKETVLATNATNGFAYFPTCAGTPTGVPSASFTGKAPIVIDSTNNKMYIYTNSAWVALN